MKQLTLLMLALTFSATMALGQSSTQKIQKRAAQPVSSIIGDVHTEEIPEELEENAPDPGELNIINGGVITPTSHLEVPSLDTDESKIKMTDPVTGEAYFIRKNPQPEKYRRLLETEKYKKKLEKLRAKGKLIMA